MGTPRKGFNDTSLLNITPAPPREMNDSSEDPIIEEPLRVFMVAAETQTDQVEIKQDQDIEFSYKIDSILDVSQQDNKSKQTQNQAIQT